MGVPLVAAAPFATAAFPSEGNGSGLSGRIFLSRETNCQIRAGIPASARRVIPCEGTISPAAIATFPCERNLSAANRASLDGG